MRQLKISKSITSRNQGTLDKYLSDIAKEPLITAEEEVALAQRIREGDQVALERLVNANLRFVVSVAKQYQNQGISLQDLINEGNIGLVKAAQRFDETRGFKFISYAVWWIRQSIMAAITDKGSLVRLPQSASSLNARITKAIHEFVLANQRQPSAEELAEILELEEGKVAAAMRTRTRHVSVDAPVGEDEDSTMIDFMTDSEAEATDSVLDRESCEADVQRVLNSLDERGRTVILRLFGIGCCEQSTEEVAMTMGLSKERVRQIREGAIQTLAMAPNVDMLRKYI